MIRKLAILLALSVTAMPAAAAPQDVDAAAERARLANERIGAERELRAREEERLRQQALADRAQAAARDVAETTPVAASAAASEDSAARDSDRDISQMLEQLRTLGELKDAGYVTDAEFDSIKRRILDGQP